MTSHTKRTARTAERTPDRTAKTATECGLHGCAQLNAHTLRERKNTPNTHTRKKTLMCATRFSRAQPCAPHCAYVTGVRSGVRSAVRAVRSRSRLTSPLRALKKINELKE